MQISMDDLAARVQSLPQELYDHIYSEVFTAPFDLAKIEIKVDDSYKPPAQLQVSRASREQFAQSYYGNTLFVFNSDDDYGGDLTDADFIPIYDTYGTLVPWLKSLSKFHFAMLLDIWFSSRIVIDEYMSLARESDGFLEDERGMQEFRRDLERMLVFDLGTAGFKVDGIVRVEVRLVDEEEGTDITLG